MAVFDPIFTQVMKHEGFYANLAGDKGGMTYAGIARNFHGSWQGWPIIDQVIDMNGGRDLPNNHYINDPLLDQYVRDFYLGIWQKSLAGYIHNQAIAHIYFDFYVNSRMAVKEVQKVLQSLGHRLSADNIPGNITLSAINNHPDQAALHDAIKETRRAYYYKIASYDQNAQFLQGWLKRLSDFPTLSTGTKLISVFAVLLLTFYLLKK